MSWRSRLVLSLVAAALACAPGRASLQPRSALGAAADPEPIDAPTAFPSEPRAAPVRQLELSVPGFLPAVLFIPEGDDERPLIVAAHGAGGAPEWECDYWRRLSRERVFVLCLRGTRMGEGAYYYKQHHALAAELDAAVAAARAQFPRIAAASGVYAGFSQGASMGSLMIGERAAQFPYVVLIEGFVLWNIPLARRFAQRGGRAVLWVCGTRDCANKAEASAKAASRSDVRASSEHAPNAGHTPVGAVMTKVAEAMPWLIQGDPLWHATFGEP